MFMEEIIMKCTSKHQSLFRQNSCLTNGRDLAPTLYHINRIVCFMIVYLHVTELCLKLLLMNLLICQVVLTWSWLRAAVWWNAL